MICLDLVGHAVGPETIPDPVRNSLFVLGAERSEGTAAVVDAIDVAGRCPPARCRGDPAAFGLSRLLGSKNSVSVSHLRSLAALPFPGRHAGQARFRQDGRERRVARNMRAPDLRARRGAPLQQRAERRLDPSDGHRLVRRPSGTELRGGVGAPLRLRAARSLRRTGPLTLDASPDAQTLVAMLENALA